MVAPLAYSEAVRPTDVPRRPRDVAKYLESDQARLYELIWLRAMASQMESAELERTTVDIMAKVGARNRAEAARLAQEKGWLNPEIDA